MRNSQLLNNISNPGWKNKKLQIRTSGDINIDTNTNKQKGQMRFEQSKGLIGLQQNDQNHNSGQYTLSQKQLMTFANQSNQSEKSIGQMPKNLFQTSQPKRQQLQNPLYISKVSNQSKRQRSKSTHKQHKTLLYRLELQKKDEFICYSVVSKQSGFGMFNNDKLLLLNSNERQLLYYSKLPKHLPFNSLQQYKQWTQTPKETISIDKVINFKFGSAKGGLGQILASFVINGQRKEWNLTMGNNKIMNQWIQIVYQVHKKKHYSQEKSQIKYPPRPKVQSQLKSNKYQTSFTKNLKQEVLPKLNSSKLSTSAVLSQDKPEQQKQKQYYVPKSKFINSKNYIIDIDDAREEDVLYQPTPIKQIKKVQQVQFKKDQFKPNQQYIVDTSKIKINKQALQAEYSIFAQQLNKKQAIINQQHLNRIKNQIHQIKTSNISDSRNSLNQSMINPLLSKKSSNSSQRLLQTTHQQFNVHVDNTKYQQRTSPKRKNNLDFKKNKLEQIILKTQQNRQRNFTQTGNKQKLKISQYTNYDKNIKNINNPNRTQKTSLNEQSYYLTSSWLFKWLTCPTTTKVNLYQKFITCCTKTIQSIFSYPQKYIFSSQINQNRTYLKFIIDNVQYVVSFKLNIPAGFEEFLQIIDFVKSQDVYTNLIKYQQQIIHQFQTYKYFLQKISKNRQQNNHQQDYQMHLPLSCLINFKGIYVFCKALVKTQQIDIIPLSMRQIQQYKPIIKQLQEKCELKFNISQKNNPFCQINYHSQRQANKKYLYLDNIQNCFPTKFDNLNNKYQKKSPKINLIIPNTKSQSNSLSQVILKLKQNCNKIVSSFQLYHFILQPNGFTKADIGQIYNQVPDHFQNVTLKTLLLTEIVLIQFVKMVRLKLIQQFIRQFALLQNVNNKFSREQFSNQAKVQFSNNSKTIKNLQMVSKTTHTNKFNLSNQIYEMIRCLVFKNTKLWSTILIILSQKYNLLGFSSVTANVKNNISNLYNKINLNYLMCNFFQQINIQCQIKRWKSYQTWSDCMFSQNQMGLTPYVQCFKYSLQSFCPQYKQIKKLLVDGVFDATFSNSESLHNWISEVLDLQQQSINHTDLILTCPKYTTLPFYQQCLILCILSLYTPLSNHANKLSPKYIDIYQKLTGKNETRISKGISYVGIRVGLAGIKWLIKSRHFQLAVRFIQQVEEALNIWVGTAYALNMELFDLAALFYHKKLNNQNNLALIYSKKSLQIAIDRQDESNEPICAQKAFQAGNIHYQCNELQSAYQLFSVAQKLINKLQLSAQFSRQDLSIQFLKIFLKKGQIKLSLGSTTQTLTQCLNLFKKCQYFKESQYKRQQSTQCLQQTLDQIEELELQAFLLIFRSSQITKSYEEINKIANICCRKYAEDKIISSQSNHQYKRSVQIKQSISVEHMSKLLKMCWISIISDQTNQINKSTPRKGHQKQIFNPFCNRIDSFCLNRLYSDIKQQSYSQSRIYKLQKLKNVLVKFSQLYKRQRYESETLTDYICQEIINFKYEYKQKNNIQNGDSFMFNRINQTISFICCNQSINNQTTFFNKTHNVQRTNHMNREQNTNMNYYNTNYLIQGRKSSRQRGSTRFSSNQKKKSNRTSINFQRCFNTQTQKSNNFYERGSNQPELYSINYDLNNLKSQTQRHYMFLEAINIICGESFIIGILNNTIQDQRKRQNQQKQNNQRKQYKYSTQNKYQIQQGYLYQMNSTYYD